MSIGTLRRRLPVAATIAEVPASPIPPGEKDGSHHSGRGRPPQVLAGRRLQFRYSSAAIVVELMGVIPSSLILATALSRIVTSSAGGIDPATHVVVGVDRGDHRLPRLATSTRFYRSTTSRCPMRRHPPEVRARRRDNSG
jgi:hypothetical protein